MSHFFTKVKQEELSALANLAALFDLAQLQTALAPGQILKAQPADADGIIKFAQGTDDSGSDFSLPSGTAGQFLSSDGAGGSTFVDGPAPLPSGMNGQLLSIDGSGNPEFVDAPSIPSSLSDFLPALGDDDYRIAYDNATDQWVLKTALPDATAANQGSILVSSGTVDGGGVVTDYHWTDVSIPALSFLVDPSTLTVGQILKVGTDAGGTKIWEVSADNMGDILPSGMHEGDVLTWSFSSGGSWAAAVPTASSSLPDGNSDGDLLVWYGVSPQRSENWVEVEFAVDASFGSITIDWLNENQWRSHANPILVKFRQSSSAGATVTAFWDQGATVSTLTFEANWNSGAGGVAADDYDNKISAALVSTGAGSYLQVNGTDSTMAPADIGLVESMGSIANGSESSEYIIKGLSGWLPEGPDSGPALDNKLCDGTQIITKAAGDLNIGGETEILIGDTQTVVIVLSDWGAATTGTVNLKLREGTVGQHVYIKNYSGADEGDRTITVSCGTTGVATTDGSIDLVKGAPGVSLSGLANMHLLCIDDSTTDGDWIIL